MNKPTLIRGIDLLSFLTLLTLISTGLVLYLSLPARSRGASVWGLTRHEWGDIHTCVSMIFLVLMCVHLLLHLKFIKAAIAGKVASDIKYRLIIGFVALATLLAVALAPVLSPVEPGSGTPRHGQHK